MSDFASEGRLDVRGPNGLHLRSIRGRDRTEFVNQQRLFQAVETRQANGRGHAQTGEPPVG